MKRALQFGICCFLILVIARPYLADKPAPKLKTRFATSRDGMVATGSPEATSAALKILRAGGNAIDAAAAAHAALMVTDPANTSLGGRAQILLRLRDGRVIALDGATQTPASVTSLKSQEDRRGYAVAPVPGNLAVLSEIVRRYGKLKLADVLQPAIELAEKGFRVRPRLAALWVRYRDALLNDPGAAQNFLKSDGSPYEAGEIFVQPRLARVLRQVAESGVAIFYKGEIAEVIAKDHKRRNGFITRRDLAEYRVRPGVVVRTSYHGHQIVSGGGRAWGNTLVQMLNILENFSMNSGEVTAEQLEIIAHVISQALEDRPQEIGTLKPKVDGYSLATLSSRRFAKSRAALIKQKLRSSSAVPATGNNTQGAQVQPKEEHDTTHLSVMDSEGNSVSLTTSIGPSFGARVATLELGFLYAHSYRMRSDPTPGNRDATEMTPTIVFRRGQPRLVIGAAGSERIPTAILQVISNVIDRGYTLERAVSAPRVFSLKGKLRMQPGFPAPLVQALSARGFQIETLAADFSQHLGLVHAVRYNPVTKEFIGAVDPGSDGSAEGPE